MTHPPQPKTIALAAAAAVLAGLLAADGPGHFQVLLPSTDVVVNQRQRTVELDILFTHPMEQGPVMEMGPPTEFGVLVGGEKRDLLETLQPRPIDGKTTFAASYTIKTPGDHVFYLAPAPYWEPAEEKMIVHYTKVVVSAYGEESGWDTMIGFPVEIEPLVRPYGLWTGNQFRGIVRKAGRPAPFAEVEVEYYNEAGRVEVPSPPFVTQVIKADVNGVFSYTMPRAGWWGFAALVAGDKPMRNPGGEEVEVELGALMWVKTTDMTERGGTP